MSAEVSDCGLKLKIIYPPAYENVEMVSTCSATTPRGVQIEHIFSESDMVTCEKIMKKGGGTYREFPENLLKSGEEDWNKWCAAPCRGNTNWTLLQF